MKVLIAEDEQTIANGIAAILKTRGEFHLPDPLCRKWAGCTGRSQNVLSGSGSY